jgi:hypothetical protein
MNERKQSGPYIPNYKGTPRQRRERAIEIRFSNEEHAAATALAQRNGYQNIQPYIRHLLGEHGRDNYIHLDTALRKAGTLAAEIIGTVAGSIVAEAERQYLEGPTPKAPRKR